MFSQLLPWTTALTLVVITAIVLHKRGRRRTAAAVAAATSKARVSLSVPTVIETPPSPQPRRKDRTRSVSSVVAWTADDVMEWLSSRGYEDVSQSKLKEAAGPESTGQDHCAWVVSLKIAFPWSPSLTTSGRTLMARN